MSAAPESLGIGAMLHLLSTGQGTPEELVRQAIGRAEDVNPWLNAFAAIGSDRALRDAAESAKRWREGRARPLEGIPVAVKDLIDTEDMETRYGSAAYLDNRPAADAETVRRLRDQGAIVIAKTTTHEFAWGVTTASTHFGDTRNPHDETRIPGGSSGGAAVAIASGVVAAGIGTDTGGSVRIPASLCGVTGFKPTHGRLSTAGIFPLAPTLDHAGVLGAAVADVLHLSRAFGLYPNETPRPKARLGIIRGIPPVPLEDAVAEAFDRGVASLSAAHEAREIDHAGLFDGVFAAFAGIVLTEASVEHYRRNSRETIEATYEPETRERLERAKSVRLEDYFVCQDARRAFAVRLRNLMEEVDFLMLPTVPCVAPRIGQSSVTIGGWSGMVREALMTYAAPFNMAGFPAISLPLKVPAGSLPCGLQIVARPGEDGALLRFAAEIEPLLRS